MARLPHVFIPTKTNRVTPSIVSLSAPMGTRPGCVAGTTGFDIAAHHFVYSKLILEFPHFVIKALTADMPSFFRPPATPDGKPPTDEACHHEYDNLYQLLRRYDHYGNPIGLFRHPEKGLTWLPPEAPPPRPDHPLLSLTTIVSHGVKITGGFFGNDEGTVKFCLDKVTSLQHRVNGIVSLHLQQLTCCYATPWIGCQSRD